VRTPPSIHNALTDEERRLWRNGQSSGEKAVARERFWNGDGTDSHHGLGKALKNAEKRIDCSNYRDFGCLLGGHAIRHSPVVFSGQNAEDPEYWWEDENNGKWPQYIANIADHGLCWPYLVKGIAEALKYHCCDRCTPQCSKRFEYGTPCCRSDPDIVMCLARQIIEYISQDTDSARRSKHLDNLYDAILCHWGSRGVHCQLDGAIYLLSEALSVALPVDAEVELYTFVCKLDTYLMKTRVTA